MFPLESEDSATSPHSNMIKVRFKNGWLSGFSTEEFCPIGEGYLKELLDRLTEDFFKKEFIEAQLIYDIVLVSGVQIYTYYIYMTSIFFFRGFRLYSITSYHVVPCAIQ